jgi:hypothetical protein
LCSGLPTSSQGSNPANAAKAQAALAQATPAANSQAWERRFAEARRSISRLLAPNGKPKANAQEKELRKNIAHDICCMARAFSLPIVIAN